jgi:uncharacterized protein YggE
MKSAVLAALILAAALGPAQAQTVAPRTLTMTGQGEVRAAPDSVTLSAGVTSQGQTATAALAANITRMQGVFAALKKLGVSDKDMQTRNFSVSPMMSDGANNQPPRVTGYQVNNQARVRLNDVTKLGAALDALVTAGANQVNSVDFTIKDPARLLTQARGDAVADARAKAETYAKAAGVSLVSILSISENENSGRRPLYAAMAMVRCTKGVPMAAGEESVTAQVSIVWEIC